MTTLVTRKYFTLGAPPAVLDVDVGLGILTVTMQIDSIGNMLETGGMFQAGPVKLSGHYFKQGKYFELPFIPMRGTFQANGSDMPAGVKTREGLREDWGDEIWPDVTWIEYTYLIGDFYHRIVP